MNFKDFIDFNESSNINEAVSSNRYGIDVNFRTSAKQALESFAKICLGYVSAALKRNGYHIKHVYEDKPIRIIISSRNFDDGEWSGVLSFNPDAGCFMIGTGYYNKLRKTVSLQSTRKCNGESPAEMAAELNNLMHSLKDKPDRHLPKMKPVQLKRGPKS